MHLNHKQLNIKLLMNNISNLQACTFWTKGKEEPPKYISFESIKLKVDSNELCEIKKILRKNQIEFQINNN